jgi:hypothetical protein
MARELIAVSRCDVPTRTGVIQIRLIRFWNREAILDCRQAGRTEGTGSTFSRLSRRELRGDPVRVLARHLSTSIRNLGADAELL